MSRNTQVIDPRHADYDRLPGPGGPPRSGKVARTWACGLAVLSVLLAGIAALSMSSPDATQADAGSLSVDSLSKSFGVVRPGEERIVLFEFINHTNRPLRLLGGGGSCQPTGCIDVQHDALPVEVPARGRRPIGIQYKSGSPGDFSEEITVYTNAPSADRLVLRVSGKVIDDGIESL